MVKYKRSSIHDIHIFRQKHSLVRVVQKLVIFNWSDILLFVLVSKSIVTARNVLQDSRYAAFAQ